jgi:hypothetical protein
MKKIILPGVIAGIAILVLGMLVSYLFMLIPSVSADYANTAIMRQWQDPLMMLFFLYPFILGIILAFIWDKSKTLFKGTLWKRGCNFGLAIFLIATIPGMFITYTSMPYSLMTVISWTVGGLLNALVAGWIFAKMNK